MEGKARWALQRRTNERLEPVATRPDRPWGHQSTWALIVVGIVHGYLAHHVQGRHPLPGMCCAGLSTSIAHCHRHPSVAPFCPSVMADSSTGPSLLTSTSVGGCLFSISACLCQAEHVRTVVVSQSVSQSVDGTIVPGYLPAAALLGTACLLPPPNPQPPSPPAVNHRTGARQSRRCLLVPG